jgi:hypothetical protein
VNRVRSLTAFERSVLGPGIPLDARPSIRAEQIDDFARRELPNRNQSTEKTMTTTYDFSRLAANFAMTDPVVVTTNGGGDPVVAYTNEYQGKVWAHVRTLFQDKSGRWAPTKAGFSAPADEVGDVILRIAERFSAAEPEAAEPAPKTAAATRRGHVRRSR